MTIQERNQMLTQRRWRVLAACCIANLCLGGLYAWSVFAGPMAEHLNALHGTAMTAADLALAFSFSNSLTFITMIAGGYLEKKIGARRIIFVGVVLFGAGFLVCGMARSVLAVIFGFGVIGGLANGLGYVCTVSTAVKFFPDKKGLIGGISTASYGISSVIIPPVADALNRSVGISSAFTIFGLVIIVLGGLCSLFILNCPDDYTPTGWDGSGSAAAGSGRDTTALQMLASPIFYVMLGMMFIGATIGLMMISEASAIAQTMLGMSSSAAALVVSTYALFNTGSRIVVGWISDKIGRIRTITFVFVLMALSLQAIYLSGSNGNTFLFRAGICLIGFSYGSFMGVYPAFTSDQFGVKYSALNYGILFIGFSLAGVVGPLAMQKIFSEFGSYRPSFPIAIVFALAGIALTFLYRAVNRKFAEKSA